VSVGSGKIGKKPEEKMMGLLTNIVFSAAKNRVLSRGTGDAGENPATFDAASYQDWRTSELEAQYRDHFSAADLLGKDVLDFGCGEGDLSFLVANLGARSVKAVDVDAERVESARERARDRKLRIQPEFFVASTTTKIDLPDESVDVILCFDVLEHILDYEAVLPEWRRVLRPGGRIMIWWVPWLHPYGHHIESLVPLPWVHAFLPDSVLTRTCARVYDLPEFKPRVWDLDEQGNKKPNKWWNMKGLPGVNKLTMSRFEEIIGFLDLHIDKRQCYGFRTSRFRPLTEALANLPVLREFFNSYITYELRKD
jgi:SAM-dependent methyltransferase